MLARRNGRILVFSRYNKDQNCIYWHAGQVERGQVKLLVSAREWIVAMRAAELLSSGRIGEFGNWLDGYNAAIAEDTNRAIAFLSASIQ